jgi:hypothetical protein
VPPWEMLLRTAHVVKLLLRVVEVECGGRSFSAKHGLTLLWQCESGERISSRSRVEC